MAHRRLVPENKGLLNLHKLYYIPKPSALNEGRGRNLPDAYRRFFQELIQEPTAVHHIPEKRKYIRDPETGVVRRGQDDPPPVIYPKAFHKGLWGGAGMLKGFSHNNPKDQRFPRYWSPQFETSVIYSEVLDLFMTTIVTKRTIQLIHKHYGFDHYLLQTPACDLKSNLALKLKRNILLALDKNELPHKNPEKREQVYNTYKHYLEKYDSEFIQWYGLKVNEAVQKMEFESEKAAGPPQPLKVLYRQEFLEELRQAEIKKEEKPEESAAGGRLSSIISKLNIFKKSS